ncbi:hypothetical protein AB0O28_25980 [Microbispora sp. NPDC088329]|uniref:hypothetical protein n=1 Tax=Microbispora sp. NPDC088329 TaxID=3154869 RepID=UPI003412657D
MQANDVRVLKGAAVPTLIVGLLAALVAVFTTGAKGALGAGIGVVLVAAFFTVGLVVVSWAGRISPMAMMAAAVVGYVIKILAVMALMIAFDGVTAFDSRMFALSVICCTLAWMIGEMRGFMKLKLLYVEPETKVPGQGRG